MAQTTQTNGGTRWLFTDWYRLSTQQVLSGNTVTVTASNQGGDVYLARITPRYKVETSAFPAQGGRVEIPSPFPDDFYPGAGLVTFRAVPADGWRFVGWTGSASGTSVMTQVRADGPLSVVAQFAQVQPVTVTIQSNAPGSVVILNGQSIALPASLQLLPDRNYSLSAQPVVYPQGSRWVFANWSNGVTSGSQEFRPPQGGLALTINYTQEFLLNALASPVAGGQVTGAGWYRAGTTATVTTTANAGYAFSGWTGDVTASTAATTVVMSAARNLAANFTPAGQPLLTLVTGGARVDGAVAGTRVVPLTIRNTGAGAAMNVRITGVTGIAVTQGTGTVALVSPLPLAFGNIAPASSATQALLLQWPATATRVQFSVTYEAAGGRPQLMTLSLFR